jgi:DNA primase
MYHDFQSIKAQASFEAVLEMLGVPFTKSGEQLRARCPICKDANARGLVCTPAKGLYYCFNEKQGGDVIKWRDEASPRLQ